MAHSHNQTMIAKFGFSDPDKGSGEHDLACRYLIDPATIKRVAGATAARRMHEEHRRVTEEPSGFGGCHSCGKQKISFSKELTDAVFEVVQSATETVLGKGEGKFRTTVGFLDVTFVACAVGSVAMNSHLSQYDNKRPPNGGWVCQDVTETRKLAGRVEAVIEVKINRVHLGDAIRQIKFYKEYRVGEFFLATRYELTSEDVDLLAHEGISHIHLGDGFTKWLDERKRNSTPSLASISL